MSDASQEVGALEEGLPAVELELPTAGGIQQVVADMPAPKLLLSNVAFMALLLNTVSTLGACKGFGMEVLKVRPFFFLVKLSSTDAR